MNTTHPMNPPTHPTAPGYTPGPWTASDTGVLANELNEHGNFYLVGTPFPNEEMTGRDRANLRLIALAPEMAEALADMAERWRRVAPLFGNTEYDGVRADTSEAIARDILNRIGGGA